jgi:hypothetical protein
VVIFIEEGNGRVVVVVLVKENARKGLVWNWDYDIIRLSIDREYFINFLFQHDI